MAIAHCEASQWVEDTMPKVPWRVGRVVNRICHLTECARRRENLITQQANDRRRIPRGRASPLLRPHTVASPPTGSELPVLSGAE
ncbi:hypothetical protein GCM10010254_46710 [Streptomyces chromofuscus]|nr:hypothetical protein GCM10010254_46710 [Streptomyces chromofuscus]